MNIVGSHYKDHHCSPGTANYNKTFVFSRVLQEELEELQEKNDIAILQRNTTGMNGTMTRDSIVNQPQGSNPSPSSNTNSSPTFHTLVTSGCNVLQDWQCYVFFYHVMKSKQEGLVTRIVSSCNAQQQRQILMEKLLHWHWDNFISILHQTTQIFDTIYGHSNSSTKHSEFYIGLNGTEVSQNPNNS